MGIGELMNKEKLLIEITNTELRVLSGIEVIVLKPERYREGFEKVRESAKFTEEEFEEFRRGVIDTAERIEKCKSENYWAKRTHSCPSFSGCEYLPLCKADKETWEGMVKTFYKKEKWRAYE